MRNFDANTASGSSASSVGSRLKDRRLYAECFANLVDKFAVGEFALTLRTGGDNRLPKTHSVRTEDMLVITALGEMDEFS